MLNEHDQDLLLRCCRLGHEVTFGYCRQETGGKPCRLVLDCWWEQFDVRSFLQAHRLGRTWPKLSVPPPLPLPPK